MLGKKFATRLNSFSSNWSNKKNITIIDLINRAATVKGLTDVDLNYPDHTENNFKHTLNCIQDNGLKINGFAMRYYNNNKFKLGAFTNPDKKIRQEAIDLTKRGIDTAREANCNLMTLWLGQDGFDYSFQSDYKALWQSEIEGIREVTDHDQECNISIEYKPDEPRAFSLLPNLSTTLLAISQIESDNIGVTLDFAHLLYANELPAYSAAMVSSFSKLFGVHLNDAYSKRDDGLMVGSVHYQATVEFLYQISKDNYNGTIYFDTFPNVTDLNPIKECEINISTVKQILKIVSILLEDNTLSESMKQQDPLKSQQIFKEALNNLNG